MTTIRGCIIRHPASAYFTLTFAISWGGVLLAIGTAGAISGIEPTSDSRFAYALLAMLAGPSVSGLLLTAILHGRNGIQELLARVLAWRTAARWYAIALLTAPLLWSATLLALSLVSPTFLPRVVASPDKATIIIVGLAVALAAGIVEEVGWTGFAIPQIRRRHGVLATGVIVGVLWSAWHLLTNVLWAAPASAGDVPLAIFVPINAFGVFVGYLAAFRVLMVWVYEHTRSVLLAMLMHVSLTGSVLILEPDASGVAALISSYTLAVVVWAVAALATTTRSAARLWDSRSSLAVWE